jgi:ABC-2 type transport system permease protein
VNLLPHQLRWEQRVFWRSREAAIFIFVFPPLLYVLLGSVYGGGELDGRPVASYLLAGLLGYSVANTAFGGLAIQLVLRREYGILKRVRGTPLPPATYLTATLLSNLLVFVLQSAVVVALGLLLFDADAPSRPLELVVVLVYGFVCFAGLGLGAAALIRSSDAVSAVVNVVVLPMAFLSGAFGPNQDYPALLEAIGDATPLRWFIDLVLAAYVDDVSMFENPTGLLVLAAWGALGYAIAVRRFGWEPRER